jgi:hypothetical protein
MAATMEGSRADIEGGLEASMEGVEGAQPGSGHGWLEAI